MLNIIELLGRYNIARITGLYYRYGKTNDYDLREYLDTYTILKEDHVVIML